MRRKSVFFMISMFFCSSSLSFGEKASSFRPKELIVFGDSLSDVGNRCSGPLKNRPFLCFLYSTQKFSDGEIWVEHLAKHWSLEIFPSSEGGRNYAYGGATSGIGSQKSPGLDIQIKRYIEDVKGNANKEALYSLWIGANDFKNTFLSKEKLEKLNALSFDQIRDSLKFNILELKKHGAQHFLIPNIPPLHKIPISELSLKLAATVLTGISWLFVPPSKEDNLSSRNKTIQSFFDTSLNSIIAVFNWKLERELQNMREEHQIYIYHPDIFKSFKEVETKLKDYRASSLKDFFCADLFHPCSKGHQLIAHEVLKYL